MAATDIEGDDATSARPSGSMPGPGLDPEPSALSCIHQLFEVQATRHSERTALVFNGTALSYRELNERANQLARYLRSHGAKRGSLVGLCMERSSELVIGLLGILKAGCAYVPIDPQYPPERLAFMLRDSNTAIIVSETALTRNLVLADAKVVLVDRDAPAIGRERGDNPDYEASGDDLAYIIYTSGSTGTPKGSLITHYNVARLFTSTHPWFGFDQNDVWTLFHSCAFDFSVWEIWGALFYGGRVVVVPFEVSRTPDAFFKLLVDERVTVLNQTPSAFRQLIQADIAAGVHAPLALRLVIFGGEALEFQTLQPWFERHGDQSPQLVNMYGITETTVHVTYRPISARDLDGGSVIGVPIPDLRVYLLDEQQRRVAEGAAGEIHVGGAGVGRGYLNRPDLTAEKFIPDPFAAEAGRSLYRSGDLGRFLPGGELEYLGRIDQQVKLRGFRIELGEIAATLNAHPQIQDSVVTVVEDALGEKALAAYLIAKSDQPVDPAELRSLVRQRLPEYMLPATFTFIARLPLTVNGKLDVKALPHPSAPTPAIEALPGPQNTLERSIAKIWCEVLGLASVGIDQNFFDVGGNSVRIAAVHKKLQDLLDERFPIGELFSHSTVSGLALHFAGRRDARQSSAAVQSRADLQRRAIAAQRDPRRPKSQQD